MSWIGGNGSGPRAYTPQEEQRCLRAISQHRGRSRATTIPDFCRAVGMADKGRTVRAILADHDGIDFALHMQGDGDLYIAEYQDEAERTTRQHWSRARKLMARAKRREAYVTNLPRRQYLLFDNEDEDEDDDDL